MKSSITLLLCVDHVAELSAVKVGLLGLVNLICQIWSSLVRSELFFVLGPVCPLTDFRKVGWRNRLGRIG